MKMDGLRPEVTAHLAEENTSPQELHELRALVSSLGALPQVAPRRTFILTPELLGETPRQGAPRRLAWLWATRWATAVAALCFVITLGFGQVADAGPMAVAVSPTAVVAATTPTPTEPQITIFGTPSFIEPVPSAVVAPAPGPSSPAGFGVDWRPAQLFFGALTALGALIGFALPSFLRRRDMATA